MMMISKKELMSIANRLDNALMQPRQDECGRRLREVRDNMLLPNNLTFAEIFDWLLREINDSQPKVSQPKVSQSDNNLLDPTDVWVRPWAKQLEQHITDKHPEIPARHLDHVIRMQSRRGKECRTYNDIEWLKQIARLCRYPVPPECDAYLEENE